MCGRVEPASESESDEEEEDDELMAASGEGGEQRNLWIIDR